MRAEARHACLLLCTKAGRPLDDAMGFEVVAWCTAWVISTDATGS